MSFYYYFKPDATFFSLDKYPNFLSLFQKDPRHKYAYEAGEDVVDKKERVFEQLWGGLRSELTPAYYFSEFYDEEKHPGLRNEKKCFEVVGRIRKLNKLDEKRDHYRFVDATRSLAYLPLVYKPMNIPGKYGAFMWHYLNNSTRTDRQFIHEIKTSLGRISNRLDTLDDFQTTTMMLSPLVVQLKHQDSETKHILFLALAHFVERQRNLKHVVLENTQLNLSEGIRLLLLLSIAAGNTLKTLNLWYFFQLGCLPIPEKGQVFYENDRFIYSREEDLRPTTPVRERIWKEVVVKPDLCDIPTEKCPLYFKMGLSLFENLTVLWINYAWLTSDQGKILCQLGCVKFKTLKMLHLLYNNIETVERVQQKISRTAWKYVHNHVPGLEVSLTLVDVYHYNNAKQILMDNIPLVEFNMIGGLVFKDIKTYQPPWLDCIFRTLIHFYSSSLRKMSLQNWHPHQLMDVCIGKILTKIPSLEEFEYQGHVDKGDTVHKICEYLVRHKTRLKRVHLMIQYDPCYPLPWEAFVDSVNEKYKNYLSTIGIDFVLKLYKC